MEENIHDDKLDDYVRKSFEDYEEDPAPDMWDRVEADLLPGSKSPGLRTTFQRYGWQALAASVILLLFSTLVCEHLYYEQKLRALSNQTDKSIEIPFKSPQAPSVQQKQKDADLPTPMPHAANADSDKIKAVSTPMNASKARVSKFSGAVSDGNNRMPAKTATPQENTIVQSDQGLKKEGGQKNTQPESATPAADAPIRLSSTAMDNAVAEGIAPKTGKRLETGPIEARIGFVQSAETPNLLSPKLFPISPKPVKPHQGTSDWYIGAQTTVFAIKEKSRAPVSRMGHPAFASKQKKSDFSAIYWLKAGKKLKGNLSLETGLGYQQTTQTATHAPRFRFGDGIHQGPPLGTMRNFTYDLSTYSGTAEVSLRMEQTSPSTPSSDDEPVALTITTSERVKMLRIPLLAAYRLGTGRLQGNLKAGLMGNIILKNELGISARVSQNTKFQPVSGGDGYSVRLNRGKFFLGYWLSAGAEFKVNQQLSFVAEPSLTGDFPRNDKFGHRLPERFLLGLNVGANYYF